MIKPDKTWY